MAPPRFALIRGVVLVILTRLSHAQDISTLGSMAEPCIVTSTMYVECSCFGMSTAAGILPSPTEPTITGAVVRTLVPTSCYELPIPTPSLKINAIAVSELVPTFNESDIVFYYLSNNGTIPEYMGSYTENSFYMLDVSPAAAADGQAAVMFRGGGSLVFSQQGISLFNAECSSQVEVVIDNFVPQLEAIQPPPLARRSAGSKPSKREVKDFLVRLRIAKTDSSVPGFAPTLNFGQSPCVFQATTPGDTADYDVWTYACQFPGAQSTSQTCANSFGSFLDRALGSDADENGNATGTSVTRAGSAPLTQGGFLELVAGFVSQSASQIAQWMPQLDAEVLTWVDRATDIAREAAMVGGTALCDLVHALDTYELVFADDNPNAGGGGLFNLFGGHRRRLLGTYEEAPPSELEIDLVPPKNPQATETPPPREITPTATSATTAPLIIPVPPGGEILVSLPPTSSVRVSTSPRTTTAAQTTAADATSATGGTTTTATNAGVSSSQTSSVVARDLTSSEEEPSATSQPPESSVIVADDTGSVTVPAPSAPSSSELPDPVVSTAVPSTMVPQPPSEGGSVMETTSSTVAAATTFTASDGSSVSLSSQPPGSSSSTISTAVGGNSSAIP